MNKWRYGHANLAQRMIGSKIGTGGSSGHSYLSKTLEKHKIFDDLTNLSTYLIPRSSLPDLPDNLKTTVNPVKTLTPRFITRALENIKKRNTK